MKSKHVIDSMVVIVLATPWLSAASPGNGYYDDRKEPVLRGEKTGLPSDVGFEAVGPTSAPDAVADAGRTTAPVLLRDYNYPIMPGNEWWFQGTDWDGESSLMLYRVEEVVKTLVLCPGDTTGHEVVSMYCAFGTGAPGDGFTPTDTWYDYLSAVEGWGLYGADDDPGEFELRIEHGLVFADPFAINVPQSVTDNICVNGSAAGDATYSVTVLEKTALTVSAGTFGDCVHLRIEKSRVGGDEPEVEEQWWARGVGLVKHVGISGDGAAKQQELLQASIAPYPQLSATRNGEGIALDIVGPLGVTITVERRSSWGSATDWETHEVLLMTRATRSLSVTAPSGEGARFYRLAIVSD